MTAKTVAAITPPIKPITMMPTIIDAKSIAPRSLFIFGRYFDALEVVVSMFS
jgi:hypothetical protein